jgi:hypothetical protein
MGRSAAALAFNQAPLPSPSLLTAPLCAQRAALLPSRYTNGRAGSRRTLCERSHSASTVHQGTGATGGAGRMAGHTGAKESDQTEHARTRSKRSPFAPMLARRCLWLAAFSFLFFFLPPSPPRGILQPKKSPHLGTQPHRAHTGWCHIAQCSRCAIVLLVLPDSHVPRVRWGIQLGRRFNSWWKQSTQPPLPDAASTDAPDGSVSHGSTAQMDRLSKARGGAFVARAFVVLLCGTMRTSSRQGRTREGCVRRNVEWPPTNEMQRLWTPGVGEWPGAVRCGLTGGTRPTGQTTSRKSDWTAAGTR